MLDRKIFGIGWAKTGTTTLGACFEILGCSHQGQNLDLMYDVEAGRFDRIFSIVDQFDAFEDWPWILIYRDLDQTYRGSRFILTVRDTNRWWRSYQGMITSKSARPDIARIRKIIYGFESGLQHKKEYIGRYERHNAEVLHYFSDRPNDLLVVDWEKGDGWPALCRFLGKSEPNQPFPHLNVGTYRYWRGRLRRLIGFHALKR